MACVTSSRCVFCEAESVTDSNIAQLQKGHDAHRDPLLETTCIRGKRLQARSLYESLDPLEDWQIRILELQPQRSLAPLVSRLFNADMLYGGGIIESATKNRQTYVALSYYWGDDQRSRYHLECNGIEYPIPIAAYRALHRLRDRYCPTYIWIDTVCINQFDDLEKSKQVAKMRSIYQNAQQVVVYLGEHINLEQSIDGKIKSATEWLIGLLINFQPIGVLLDGTALAITDHVRRASTSGARVCAVHAFLFEQGVCEISRLKWFDRVWVKQEIWAARSVEVRYGTSILPWQSLVSIQDFLELLKPLLTPDQQFLIERSCRTLSIKLGRLLIGVPTAHAAADMNDKCNAQLLDDDDHQQDIINVFRRSEGAECSRMHDRVYGLLGMTSVNVEQTDDMRHNCFAISYGELPVDTFARLAKYIICRDHSLNILFLNTAFPRPQHASEVDGNKLPSWVPDWRYSIGTVQKHTYPPTSWSERSWDLPLQNTFGQLCIQGHLLGKVVSRIRPTSTVVEIRWTHLHLASSSIEAAEIPRGVCRFDILALFEGALMPVLIRQTSEPGNFHYVGPIHPLSRRSHITGQTSPHFNAVIAFMSEFSRQNDEWTKPAFINLV